MLRKAFQRLRQLALLAAVCVAASWGWSYWREHRFDQIIATSAHRYQLEPALVKAIVWRESRFDPEARGRAGEVGLMQVREPAALEWAASEHLRDFDYTACLDPATNTLAGSWYLKKVLRRYSMADNPLPYALAEYNAGRANVLKWRSGIAATNSEAFLGQITFPGTRAYVQSVLERREYYR
jgi:soluble lytic murein transglycosylase